MNLRFSDNVYLWELMVCHLLSFCTGIYGKTIFCAISVPLAGWMVLGSCSGSILFVKLLANTVLCFICIRLVLPSLENLA